MDWWIGVRTRRRLTYERSHLWAEVSDDLFFERTSPIGRRLQASPLTTSERIGLSSFRGFSQEQCRLFSHQLGGDPRARRLVPDPSRVRPRIFALRGAVLKEDQMEKDDTAVAVFDGHQAAEAAIKKLAGAGIDIKHLSVVGKGYHIDEKVVGFYNTGDRVKFWGKLGAFWGGLWGWLGGLFLTIPVVGHVIVLGYLAAIAISVIEGAIVVGGLSALGAALYSIGIPKDSVIAYEAAVKADKFLVMAHGPAEEVERARALLKAFNPSRLDLHEGAETAAPASHLVHAGT